MDERNLRKHAFHVFMTRHIPHYDKRHAEDFINAFLLSTGYCGNKGFTQKMKMIQSDFKEFRNWFFDKNRARLKHEL